MFALLMEPYAMIQLFILLSVMNHMGRNVASMFYHEIITIHDFIQGSLIDVNDQKSHTFYKKLKFLLNQQSFMLNSVKPWAATHNPGCKTLM